MLLIPKRHKAEEQVGHPGHPKAIWLWAGHLSELLDRVLVLFVFDS